MTEKTVNDLYGPSLAAARPYEAGAVFLLDQPALTVQYLIDGYLAQQLDLLWRCWENSAVGVRQLVIDSHVPDEDLPRDLFADVTLMAMTYIVSSRGTVPKIPSLPSSVKIQPPNAFSLGADLPVPSVATLRRVALAWLMNSHAYCGDFTVMLPSGRLLAHSCNPSLVYSSDVDGACFRTIRRVLPGEIGAFCYIDHWLLLAPTWRRRREIKESRGFICHCPRCRGVERLTCDLDASAADDTRKECEELEQLLVSASFLVDLSAAHVELVKRLGASHWLSMRAADVLGTQLVEAGEVAEGYEILKPFYETMASFQLMIFYVWPAARLAKRVGPEDCQFLTDLIDKEMQRTRMTESLGKELLAFINEVPH